MHRTVITKYSRAKILCNHRNVFLKQARRELLRSCQHLHKSVHSLQGNAFICTSIIIDKLTAQGH